VLHSSASFAILRERERPVPERGKVTFEKQRRGWSMIRFSATAFLLCVFTVSGFAGLIYEIHLEPLLKLFLGHAAYSQVLYL